MMTYFKEDDVCYTQDGKFYFLAMDEPRGPFDTKEEREKAMTAWAVEYRRSNKLMP